MKKTFLVLALSAVFLTACTQQETEQTAPALMKVNVV